MINARAETVAQKPAYRRAFATRRCIRYRSGDSLALAGVYELWRDPYTSEWLATYSIITASATDDVGHLHNRMPMVVTPDLWRAWLDPHTTDTDRASELMAPPPTGSLESYPVSTTVNNVRNNSPELIEPIQL